jgi:hypothetical protein
MEGSEASSYGPNEVRERMVAAVRLDHWNCLLLDACGMCTLLGWNVSSLLGEC